MPLNLAKSKVHQKFKYASCYKIDANNLIHMVTIEAQNLKLNIYVYISII